MEYKIVSVRITELPKDLFDPMPEIWVKYENSDNEELLFTYYPDEISFTTEEIIGLTKTEAYRLKGDKDRIYLTT